MTDTPPPPPPDIHVLQAQNEGLREEIAKLTQLVEQSAAGEEVLISVPTSAASSDGVMVDDEPERFPAPASPPAREEEFTPPPAAQSTPPTAVESTPPPATQSTPPPATKSTPPAATKSTPNAAAESTPPPAAESTPPPAAEAPPPAAEAPPLPVAAEAPADEEGEALALVRSRADSLVDAAKDGLKRLEGFAAPYVVRVEPYTKNACAAIVAAWGRAAACCEALLGRVKAACGAALLKAKENPTLARLGEKAAAVGATCKEQALVKWKEIEPFCVKYFELAKSHAATGWALLVKHSAQAVAAAKVWTAKAAEYAQPKLTQCREATVKLCAKAQAQWVEWWAVMQVKLEPLKLQMASWMQQAAMCMCAPFGNAIAYRGMASSEYPESVEAPDARAQ